MCDKCEADLAMHGELPSGFRCSGVTAELLAEEHDGIPRFANGKRAPKAERKVADLLFDTIESVGNIDVDV